MPNPVTGGTIGRTDQGVDISGTPGAAITDPVPGLSRLKGVISNWYAGQPYYWFQVLTGPFRGKFWYAAEQVRVNAPIGATFQQGQQIGSYASSGTATEFGYATASGETLSAAHGTRDINPGHSNTPEGAQFLQQIIRGSSRAPAGSGVDGWQVKASQESDGGQGSCGPIGVGGMWYSELSTVPMGTASDFKALGNLPCGTALNITNPVNGKTVVAHKRDVGAGSAFLPVMGLYPATARALGLAGGVYTVIISRADGGPLHPVRGKQVSGVAASAPTPIGRPTGAGPDTSQVFDDYETLLNTPRTAPTAQRPGAFAWFWNSFTGNWKGAVD